MNSGIPAAGPPGESLEQLFGSVFDLARQFAAQIGQDEIEARLRRTLHEAQRPAAAPRAAPSLAASEPVSALASLAADGDREAWDQIIDRYAPLVYAICRRYQLANDDAQDVAQRVWLVLVERIGMIRRESALPGWLATTTSRECLRVLRTVRRAGLLDMSAEDPALPADEATIAAEILIAEQNAAILAAFTELPPLCRQLLSMLISDPPYSYREIAAALGIPVGSIGPQRARCLSRLRRAITPAPAKDEPHPR